MVPRERVLEKLDQLLCKNDYAQAKHLLEYWLCEAERMGDGNGGLLMENELMGLCRKLGEREEALGFARAALERVRRQGLEDNVGAATTYLNSATVFKAFGLIKEALSLFEKARVIYEARLSRDDERLAGLYNNMGLALVDDGQFQKAEELYQKAVALLAGLSDKEPEQAITYLNLATAAETQLGLEGARKPIEEFLQRAKDSLETGKDRRDGNYAFVCEKCATVFGYYGWEEYALQLSERCRRIYEGT